MTICMDRSRAIRTAIAASALILALFAPALSGAESFKGETALLRNISPRERLTYFGLQYSLNDHQKKQLLSLKTAPERKEWLDRFWAENDPTPATPENERKNEHEARVELARRMFGSKKAPGWDKRGETLIRFGMPAARTKIPADIGFYRMVPPGEMWYYKKLDMIVSFQDFNLKGEYIYAFERYGQTTREYLDHLKAASQFLSFASPQELTMRTAGEIAGITNMNPDDIDYIADPEVRAVLGRDMIAAIEAEKQQVSKNNFQKYMKENPVIYSFEFKTEKLPLFFDVTAFNGGEGIVRTNINMEIPTGSIKFSRRGDTLSARLGIDVLVRDIGWNEIARLSDVVNPVQTGGDVWQGTSHIPAQLTLALEPGYYRLGIEAVDLGSGTRGEYKTNVELPSLDRGLSISDILFASSIRKTEGIHKFQKGDLQIVPHPLHAYKKPFPVIFYFEAYGLDTDKQGLSFYTVEYRITPVSPIRKGPILEEPPPAISSKFETTGFGSTQSQRLEIASENLWMGAFRLKVTVMDRRTRQTVSTESNFSILD